MCAVGGTVLLITRLLAFGLAGGATPSDPLAQAFHGMGMFLGNGVLHWVGLLFGLGPLLVGALGLLTSLILKGAVQKGVDPAEHFPLEEPWEYLPQEGRPRPNRPAGAGEKNDGC